MSSEVNEDRLPRAVEALLGTGRAGCRRCGGDGVVVVVSMCGPVYRPCQCVAPKRLRLRTSRPVSRRSAAA
jgi:hypothetical protein